ncbi:MAG: Transcription initiation factor TFIID subunit 9 [Piccolia ochrophora]|nr:MAG: Transcription initiation factor TFIID subunit 9 [Piccolia ochrophora]
MAEVNGIADASPTTLQSGQTVVASSAAQGSSHSQTQSQSQHVTAAPVSDALPSTSLADAGLSKRPRDARLIHMILASMGINAYEERVPLQLLDFAYRYTASTLQDALHLSAEGYGLSGPGARGVGGGGAADSGNVSLPALRLSIASRLNYQYQSSLPKEFLLDLAAERNRVALPAVSREWGIRLPPEKYCLTGVGWGLREDWESEADEEADEDASTTSGQEAEMTGDAETSMAIGEDNGDGEDEQMMDVFGKDAEDVDKGASAVSNG